MYLLLCINLTILLYNRIIYVIEYKIKFPGAFVDLKNVVKKGDQSSPADSAKVAGSSSSLKSDSLFAKIEEGIKENPDKAKSVGAVYLYNITENGKTVKQWSKYSIFGNHIKINVGELTHSGCTLL